MNNTAILQFVLGYQGGTVHQTARELKVDVMDILNANDERMEELCRLAQQARRLREGDDEITLINDATRVLECAEFTFSGSRFVQETYKAMKERDPVDAFYDLKLLVSAAHERMVAATGQRIEKPEQKPRVPQGSDDYTETEWRVMTRASAPTDTLGDFPHVVGEEWFSTRQECDEYIAEEIENPLNAGKQYAIERVTHLYTEIGRHQ